MRAASPCHTSPEGHHKGRDSWWGLQRSSLVINGAPEWISSYMQMLQYGSFRWAFPEVRSLLRVFLGFGQPSSCLIQPPGCPRLSAGGGQLPAFDCPSLKDNPSAMAGTGTLHPGLGCPNLCLGTSGKSLYKHLFLNVLFPSFLFMKSRIQNDVFTLDLQYQSQKH